MGSPQRKSDFFSENENIVYLAEHESAKVSVSLRDLLNIDRDIRSLEIVITDDLPVKLTFKNNFNIASLKNMVLSTLNKLFLNPKDLKTGKPLDFRYTHLHAKQIDTLMSKPAKHVSLRKRIKSKKNGCSCSKCG